MFEWKGQTEAVAEEALRRYQLLAENSRDIVLFMRAEDGRILEANAAALDAYGFTRDELLSLAIRDLRAADERELVAGQMAKAEAGGILFETLHRRRDGSLFPVEVSSRGATIGGTRTLVSVVRDITERKGVEEALRQSEARFRGAVENMPDGVILFDRDQRIIYANPEIARFLERPAQELLGRRAEELWPRGVNPHLPHLAHALATGERRSYELTADGPSGRRFTRQVTLVPLRGADGEVQQVLSIGHDVTEERRMTEELRSSDRRKDEFIAVLSHELRNPLTPIKNGLYILEHAVPGGAQAQQAKAVIDRQMGQLVRLVDDLLDVTRITRNKIQLQLQRLEVNDLVRRTMEDHRSLFEKSKVRLELTPSPRPLFVSGDWNRLAQVVGNLLVNCCKFTDPGGTTHVTVARDPAQPCVLVRIADTGVGLTPELLPRLFQPFMQADTTLNRSKGGLGLGLALVKGLTELHGGDVSASSDGPGRGAEFAVRLPLDLAEVAAPPPVRALGRRRSRRVLLIEDNVDAADSLREALELGRHVVAVASSGPDGLEKARSFRPEVVLCDIGLPGMDGFEVARAFRADETLRGACLVALTGYARSEDLQRASEAGFERHLAKPPSIETLEELLGRLSSE